MNRNNSECPPNKFPEIEMKKFLQNVYQTKTFTKIVATREELKSGKENKRFQQIQQDIVLDRHKTAW